MTFRINQFLLIGLLTLPSLATGQLSLLKSLRSADVVPVGVQPQANQLFMLFQKDCKFCIKQVREFSCLPRDLQIQLLGVGSSEPLLRKELFMMRTSYPAYKLDSSNLQKFGFSPGATPQTLLRIGDKAHLWVGVKSCKWIQKQMTSMGGVVQ